MCFAIALPIMDIQIDPHTLERAAQRGASKEEIIDVLISGVSLLAKQGRLAKAKVYEYKQTRLENYYEQKRIEVFYVEEYGKIITVTVYVFYGKWV